MAFNILLIHCHQSCHAPDFRETEIVVITREFQFQTSDIFKNLAFTTKTAFPLESTEPIEPHR